MKNQDRMVLAQKAQLDEAQLGVSKAKALVIETRAAQRSLSSDLAEFEQQLDELLSLRGITDEDVMQAEPLEVLTDQEREAIYDLVISKYHPIETIHFEDYAVYSEEVDHYLASHEFDLSQDPIDLIFPENIKGEILERYENQYGKLSWNKWDITAIGLTSILAILVDIFIVAIPSDMNFLGKEYEGSPVTKKFKDVTVKWYDGTSDSKFGQWMHKSLTALEKWAKTPYDIATNNKAKGINVDGLRPTLHRFMEFGHDPILGFIIGTLDILRGTCTVFDKNGIRHTLNVGEGTFNIFEAVLKEFCHLLSDIFTKQGLAPPFLSLLQAVSTESPFILKQNGAHVSYRDVVRFMYANGYDMRHMTTMSIEPLIINICINGYYNLANFESLFDKEKDIRHIRKKSNMLAVTHSVAMGGDILKLWLNGWNPLAFNYAELIALVLSVLKALKKNRQYHDMVEDALTDNWYRIVTEAR